MFNPIALKLEKKHPMKWTITEPKSQKVAQFNGSIAMAMDINIPATVATIAMKSDTNGS